jgi:hypothetical protein
VSSGGEGGSRDVPVQSFPGPHIMLVPLLAGKLIQTLTRSEGPAAFMGLSQGQMERRIGMELVAEALS